MALFNLQGTIQLLKDIGIIDFFLPFLLVFAIVYGVLERAQIFGADRHDINAVIAMVIGFMFGITGWSVRATQAFLPWVGVLAIFILGILILVAMFFPDFFQIMEGDKYKIYRQIGAGVAIVVMIVVILDMFGVFEKTGGMTSSELWGQLIGLIIFGAIFVGALAFIIKGSKRSGGSGGSEE